MPSKVEIKLTTLRSLRRLFERPVSVTLAKRLGNEIVKLMRGSALIGKSPIAGKGSFPAYRGQYRKQIRAGKIRGKGLRPINLKASGDFLVALTFKIKSQFNRRGTKRGASLRVGFFDSESILKEAGHRKGTNKQAKRPMIPKSNENFSRVINKRMKIVFVKDLKKALKRGARRIR